MSVIVFPGQGAQHKGMGVELFNQFKEITAQADAELGYSVADLCRNDPDRKLNLTQYTQPALYTVNALHFLQHQQQHDAPIFLAGHSLGEYNALLAAGAFDFITGLRLVKKRGELMSQARDGGMLAVVNANEDEIEQILRDQGLYAIDIANYNSTKQLVLSGASTDIKQAKTAFDDAKVFSIPLNVSGAFHSRYMAEAAEGYAAFIKDIQFEPLNIPVLSNVTGLPYEDGQVATGLVKQLCGSVQWVNSIRYLQAMGETTITEVGPREVVTKLNEDILEHADPLVIEPPVVTSAATTANKKPEVEQTVAPAVNLGSVDFIADHRLKYPYVAGSMCQGIAGAQLVTRMAAAGFLAFIGTAGLNLKEVEQTLLACLNELGQGVSFGLNVHHTPGDLSFQQGLVDLCLQHAVPCIELAGFDHIPLELVKYRAQGLSQNGDQLQRSNKILVKTAKAETAALFMQAAPLHMLNQLLADDSISTAQHELAQQVAMADDICVCGDSAWKTEQASTLVKLPEIIRLRDQHNPALRHNIRVGSAGGLGTPEAIAAVFMLGADFVLTGSINQCTVEAQVSDQVKDLLVSINSEDTCHVPDGELFESGARAQVLRKGSYFPARAQKLYDLYRAKNGLHELSAQEQQQLEQHFFKRSLTSVYQEFKDTADSTDIQKANSNNKYQMATVFRRYFQQANQLAVNDHAQVLDNCQIYCGPALGAFNRWAADGPFASWRDRHVDAIALSLLQAAADFKHSAAA